MLQFQEFSAWITVEDEEAQEFNVETLNDEKRVCCWIPSEIGKTFKVHWKDSTASTPTSGWVFVDGNKWEGKLIDKAHSGKTITSSGYRQSATGICPYTFAKVDLTDDDAFLSSSINGAVGVIEIEITRVQVVGNVPFTPIVPPLRQTVHERSKKGADHQVQLGKAIAQKPLTHVMSVLPLGDPVVKFVFKYRPIDVLRANGIAPQPPRETNKRKASDALDDDEVEVGDVKPVVDDDDVLDLTGENSDDEELQQLNRRIAEIKAAKRQQSSKKVKREVVKREKLVVDSDEVIDLT